MALSLSEALKRQKTETIRTLEVVIQSSNGQDEVRAWVHAYRLSLHLAQEQSSAIAAQGATL